MVKSTAHFIGLGGGPPDPEQVPISTWMLADTEQSPFETTTVKTNEPPAIGKVPGAGVYEALVAPETSPDGPYHWYVAYMAGTLSVKVAMGKEGKQ